MLTVSIYNLTHSFPKEEIYGLNSQIRRSSSVPINIAKCCGRGSNADFRRLLQIAFGTVIETEYFLLLCFERGYLSEKNFTEMNHLVQ